MGLGKSSRSPKFVKAKSEEELQRLMLSLQLRLGLELKWLTIYRVGSDVVAWYFLDRKLEDVFKELV